MHMRMRRLSSVMALAVGAIVACSNDDDGVEDGHGVGGPHMDVSGNGAAGALYIDGGPPGVQFVGRFDTRDEAGPKCGWPGCRILARFSGTSVSVNLRELDESWMEGSPSEWDVAVDDAWQDKIVTSPGTKTYVIASGLTGGTHKVELYKRSEAQTGVTQFLGFDFGGGTLAEPPPIATRHIEIIGDSAAAGFGVEGVGYADDDCPGLDYAAQWENFRKSFGPVLASSLDAELHGTVYSGKGIVKNIWRADPDTMPRIFPLTNPADPSSTYDFAWKPDVVVMMIGGNDFANGQPDESDGNGPASASEFTEGYRKFVETLRSHYPSAHLFLSPSPSLSDEEPAGRMTRTNVSNATTTVAEDRNAAGDARVYAFAPSIATADELTACNGHGSPAFHRRVASEFQAIIKQKAGW